MQVVAVTTTPFAFDGNLQRIRGTNGIHVALGLHPQIVGTRYADLNAFKERLSIAQVVGEVGLDASPAHYARFAEQKIAFEEVVRACVVAGGKPMSVHSVRSAKEVLNVIERCDPDAVNRYALHWFTGSASDTKAAISRGCYFSINQAMLGSSRWEATLALVPRNMVLTETDGPFISNELGPIRPRMVATVVDRLADLWQVSNVEAGSIVLANFGAFMKGKGTA